MNEKNILKVVIADDSDTLRSRLVNLLSENPAVGIIGEARHGLGASVLIKKMKPDVAILDIRMPGETGIEALKRVKKLKSAPIVIILTNFPYKQYKDKCTEAGADYFFDKSTDFEKIPEILAHLLEKEAAGNDLPA